MKKYIIDIKQGEYFNAGFKAKVDVDNILSKVGFETKFLKISSSKKMSDRVKDSFSAYRQLKTVVKNLENDSVILFQYPIDLISYKYAKYIKKYAQKKNIKTICIVHDINALHNLNKLADLYYKKMKMEIRFFGEFDYLISHNECMTKYLVDCGIEENKIINLGIFDYITDNVPEIDTSKINKIIIAGNLSEWKSGYIYMQEKLKNDKYSFELFGSEYTRESTEFVHFNGAFKSDELPEHINFGFGLIWDGQSIDKISGSFGEYLRYNNPHKFSLYMATGIPVIVWKESALSKFVEENKIGYTIQSLYELEEIFAKIKKEEYLEFIENVKKVQNKVIHGEYLLTAVNKILNKI